MRTYLKRAATSIVKILNRKAQPVVFGDMNRTEPVSQAFGLDRGNSIGRRYVDKFIAANSGEISGRALEVGDLRYLTRFGARTTKRQALVPRNDFARDDVDAGSVLIADLTVSSSCEENAYDCFVCTQTLNFIYDVRMAIQSIHRLLAPGGVLLGTVSGISQISRYDMDRWGDYWRFTTLSLEKSLGEAFGDNVSVYGMGNALAAQLFLQGVAVEDLPDPSVLDHYDHNYQVIIGFLARKISG